MEIQVGQFVHAMLLGIVAALIVTSVLLMGYRRAVARTMRTSSTQPDVMPSPIVPATAVSHSEQVLTSSTTRRRLVLVYALAFAASALVLSFPLGLAFFRESGTEYWPGWTNYFLSQWAPSVVLLCALAATSRRATLGAVIAAGLACMALAIVLPVLARALGGRFSFDGLAANAGWAAAQFAVTALPALVLVYVSGRRRVRNIMPVALVAVMLLSLLLLAFTHWQMVEVQDLSRTNALLMWLVTNIGFIAGPGLMFLVLSVPVGLLAWWLLQRLQRRYETHRFSNVQLMVHAWWALIVAFQSLSIVSDPAAVVGIAILSFAVFALVVRVGLGAAQLDRRQSGPTMLLLRVFGFQRRTEDLFDRMAERWRFEGPVAMIAGVDLALRSVDIDEALAYLQGSIESRYVAGPVDLEQRLRAMDVQADPDGRFRAEEFFCFDNTWKQTLTALVGRASVILMDLRGFTQANAGCVYELNQLAALGAIGRCVLVVDSTTDRALAERSLGLTSEAAVKPTWIEMQRQAAGLSRLWRELARGIAPASIPIPAPA